jgi:hypothetical protein
LCGESQSRRIDRQSETGKSERQAAAPAMFRSRERGINPLLNRSAAARSFMRTAFLTLWLVAVSSEASTRTKVMEQGERLSLLNGQAVVDTFINGQGPFHMLIDTGASRCAVRPVMAARVGLVPTGQLRLASLLGQKTVPVAPATVRVGPLELPQTEIVINDMPALDELAPNLDGLLGQSFLARTRYLIHQTKRRLWFGEAAAAHAQRFGPPTPVDFSIGRPVLPVMVGSNSKPVQLLLDGGVNVLVLRCPNRCVPSSMSGR